MGPWIRGLWLGTAVAAALVLGPALAEEKVVNVYNWSDYIGEHTIAEKRQISWLHVRRCPAQGAHDDEMNDNRAPKRQLPVWRGHGESQKWKRHGRGHAHRYAIR